MWHEGQTLYAEPPGSQGHCHYIVNVVVTYDSVAFQTVNGLPSSSLTFLMPSPCPNQQESERYFLSWVF